MDGGGTNMMPEPPPCPQGGYAVKVGEERGGGSRRSDGDGGGGGDGGEGGWSDVGMGMVRQQGWGKRGSVASKNRVHQTCGRE